MRDLAAETGGPTLAEIRAAGTAVFEARAEEAQQLGYPGRAWPPTVTAHPNWADDYKRAAASAGMTLSFDEAVAEVSNWITQLDTA